MTNLLAERAFVVTGVDATEESLDVTCDEAAQRGVKMDYRLGDLRDLPVDRPVTR